MEMLMCKKAQFFATDKTNALWRLKLTLGAQNTSQCLKYVKQFIILWGHLEMSGSHKDKTNSTTD